MKSRMTSGAVALLLLAGLLALAFGPGISAAQPTFVQGDIITLPLWTWSDGINVGTVTVGIEGDSLAITLETTGGWQMYETHFYWDTTWPGWSFPFPLDQFFEVPLMGPNIGVKLFVPLESIGVECGDTLYISVHALVMNDSLERDAWGQEDPSEIGWHKYFSVTLPCEERPAGKSPGWWKHQFNAHVEGRGSPHVSWNLLYNLTYMINWYYGMDPPDFGGYPLPPVSSLDYDGDMVFTRMDAYHLFNDRDWNHLWTPLANWYNWAYGLDPYW